MALALWAAAAASESRLVSQPALLAAAWVALFTLPAAYAMCRCGTMRIHAPSRRQQSGGLLPHVPCQRQRNGVHRPLLECCSCHVSSCATAASRSLQSVSFGMTSTHWHTASCAWQTSKVLDESCHSQDSKPRSPTANGSGGVEYHCRRALDLLAEELLAAAAAVLTSGAMRTVLGARRTAVAACMPPRHSRGRRAVIGCKNRPDQPLQRGAERRGATRGVH